MKVLFVNPFYSPEIYGGAEVVLQALVEGLTARGLEVAVLVTSDRNGLHVDEVNGVRIWRAGLRNVYWHRSHTDTHAKVARALWRLVDIYNPLMMKYVDRVIEAEKPDVASVHNVTGWSISAWSALLNRGVPIIQILHDYQLMCRGLMFTARGDCGNQCAMCKLVRYPHKILSQRLSGVAGVSKAILDRYLLEGYFIEVPERRVIYNARTAALSWKTADQEASGELRPYRFGYIGALAPHKGVEVLIGAFKLAGMADTELWIAGDGDPDYMNKLKRTAQGSPIQFRGHTLSDMFYGAVDAVVVPSLWNEPLTTVILECLAINKPVICSNKGGNPEMVQDGNNGFIFNPEKPQELSQAMRRMRDSSGSLPASRPTNDPNTFANKDRFLDDHLDLYTTVIRGCHRDPPR